MSYLFSTFLFIVLSGFILSKCDPVMRERVEKLGSHPFLLNIILNGLLIYFVSYVLGFELLKLCKDEQSCQILKMNVVPFSDHLIPALYAIIDNPENTANNIKVVATSVNAIVISAYVYFLFYLTRTLLPKDWFRDGWLKDRIQILRQQKTISDIVKDLGDQAAFLYECMFASTPVLITLKNRKVYVCYLLKIPFVIGAKEDPMITILPLRSGYRRESDLRMILDNDYEQIWSSAEHIFSDFETSGQVVDQIRRAGILIKWSDIQTLAKWVPEIYANFNPHDDVERASA